MTKTYYKQIGLSKSIVKKALELLSDNNDGNGVYNFCINRGDGNILKYLSLLPIVLDRFMESIGAEKLSKLLTLCSFSTINLMKNSKVFAELQAYFADGDVSLAAKLGDIGF